MIVNAVRSPVAVSEPELRDIAVQVLLITVLIHAFHPPLENREIAFNRVCVNNATTVFTLPVANEIVLFEILVKLRILAGFVGVDRGFLCDVFAQYWEKGFLLEIVHDEVAGAARIAIHEGKDFVFVVVATTFLLAFRLDDLVVTDKRLVHFDDTTTGTERGQVARAHRLTDTVFHEPRRLIGHAKGAV